MKDFVVCLIFERFCVQGAIPAFLTLKCVFGFHTRDFFVIKKKRKKNLAFHSFGEAVQDFHLAHETASPLEI